MAYLAGSAYLEWLAAREGPEGLPRLWKRMASRRGGSFDDSFRAVFGETPRDLYGRFTAEITARGVAEEKRLQEAGLVEGETWQRLRGGTLAPEVSRDGKRLVVRRDPSPDESYLAVWELAESEEERRDARDRARRRSRATKDHGGGRRPARVRRSLARPDGRCRGRTDTPRPSPRFLPDGESVLFARRAPDADGVLRWDLYRWRFVAGGVERVTRLADVRDADPDPAAASRSECADGSASPRSCGSTSGRATSRISTCRSPRARRGASGPTRASPRRARASPPCSTAAGGGAS